MLHKSLVAVFWHYKNHKQPIFSLNNLNNPSLRMTLETCHGFQSKFKDDGDHVKNYWFSI